MRTVIAAISLITSFQMLADDVVRIYVYAQRQTAARSWLSISCNGAAVAELKPGTLFAMNVDPGRYTLNIERGIPVFVDVRSNEESFVRLDWNYNVGRPAIPVLRTIRPDRARAEMRFLSYIDAKRVLSQTRWLRLIPASPFNHDSRLVMSDDRAAIEVSEQAHAAARLFGLQQQLQKDV